MSFLRRFFFKSEEEVKPLEKKPIAIMVPENQFQVISIGLNQPYKIYSAYPLLSCFAYVFFYEKNDGEKETILLHAKGGVLNPDILSKIHALILSRHVSPNTVDILIAISGKEEDAEINDQIKNESMNQLTDETYQFSKDRISSIKNVMMYSVDTLGNHAETITPTSTKKLQP